VLPETAIHALRDPKAKLLAEYETLKARSAFLKAENQLPKRAEWPPRLLQ
jgi:cell division protein FtsB